MIISYLNELHIRTKLTLLITTVSAIAIALLCLGVIFYDLSTLREELSSQQRSLLQIVNRNISAAIVFGDVNAINENLALYQYQPDVMAVSVIDANNGSIASYVRENQPLVDGILPAAIDWDNQTPVNNAFFIQEEIYFDSGLIGYSRVLVSLEVLEDKVWFYVNLGALAMSIILIIAFVIARRFARLFSEPLEELVETAKEVSKSGDYSARALPHSSDEVGLLTRYFNEMLEEIERRDKGHVRQQYSLEQLVESKTHEIRSALEKSEAASQAKSEFLANMSHELRTPLNAILGFSEIMFEELFGAHTSNKYKEYSCLIHESGAHLLDIINDLLDLTKVAAGKTELRIESTNITEIANEVIEMMSVRAQRKHQQLSLSVNDEIPAVNCDRRIIKQILVNLISNAVKFTHENGKIQLVLDAPDKGFVRIRVCDTGLGMTEEEIRVAMQPFGQAQSILSRSHEGTGLGLPLVQQFLELHKANLHIQSTPGKGTDVGVKLPIGETSNAQPAKEARPIVLANH